MTSFPGSGFIAWRKLLNKIHGFGTGFITKPVKLPILLCSEIMRSYLLKLKKHTKN